MSRVTKRLLGKLAERRRRSDVPRFAVVQRLPGEPPIDYRTLPPAGFVLIQDFVGDADPPSAPGFASRTASQDD